MEFVDRVRSEIDAQGLTQKLVAERAGVSFRTFTGWLQKGREPSATEAVHIARALNVSVEYLADGQEGSSSMTAQLEHRPALREAVERASRLDDNQLRKLSRLIDACFAEETEAPPTQHAAEA